MGTKPTVEDTDALRAIREKRPVTADILARLEGLGLIRVEATLTRAGLAALDKATSSAIVAEVIGDTSEAFAKRALAAARSVPKRYHETDRRGGWWGTSKVFINHAWRAYSKRNPRTSLDEFKSALIQAQRDGYLNLSRADLVEAMNPSDVSESNTRNRGATYNFIYVGG